MDYSEKFLVAPGSRVRLDRMDPSYTGKHKIREKALEETTKEVARMARLQALLWADATKSLLVALQAVDAGGKDGVMRHLFSSMNPQGTSVFGFKQPNRVEAAHDFLWRAHLHAPGKGEVAIFNRSHYEDVLVVRVHKLVPKADWSLRYDRINEFETLLADNGTRILKFFLHISPEEQLSRFKQRLDDPGPAMEDRRERLHRAGAVGPIHRRLRGRDGADQHQARALVHHSGEPEVVSRPGDLAALSRTPWKR